MRRLVYSALALIFLTAALAEPVVALQTEHACCRKHVPAAQTPMASCHEHPRAPVASVSESHAAHSECPNRCCCLGMARQTAQPESSPSSVAALQFVATVRASQFQPLSQAELPAPSGRAPPSRLFC